MTAEVISGSSLSRLLGRSWHAGGPAYRALADAVRLLILDGRVAPDTKVPGERELAGALGLSRTTVAAAYDALRERGFLVSRRGSGTRAALPGSGGPAGLARVLTPGLSAGADELGGAVDLTCAALEAPAGLHAAVAAATEALPAHLGETGYAMLGVPVLREAIAARFTARGLPTRAEQVLVTSGALQAFALVLRMLVGPGDRVLVDHPTYPNALEAVRGGSGRLVPVGLDAAGWDLPVLAASLRQAAPRLAYLVPDFHNPTGALMPASDRKRLAELLGRAHTPVVVDETLVDLTLDRPESALPPPVAAFDRTGLVLTVGSASKSFWGGLRVGWIRAAEPMIDRLVAVRASLDLGTPIVEQLAVAHLLEHRDALLATRRELVRQRRDALAEALREHLPSWRFTTPAGGLALWCELDAPVSTALAATAAGHGVLLAPGPRFGVDGAFERFLRLPYTLPSEQLVAGVARIAAVHDRLAETPTAPPLVLTA